MSHEMLNEYGDFDLFFSVFAESAFTFVSGFLFDHILLFGDLFMEWL